MATIETPPPAAAHTDAMALTAAVAPKPLPSAYLDLVENLAVAQAPDLGTIHGVILAAVQVMAVMADQLTTLAKAGMQTKTVKFDADTINGLATPIGETTSGLASLAAAVGQTHKIQLSQQTLRELSNLVARARSVGGDVHVRETVVERSGFVDRTGTIDENVEITDLEENVKAKASRRPRRRKRPETESDD